MSLIPSGWGNFVRGGEPDTKHSRSSQQTASAASASTTARKRKASEQPSLPRDQAGPTASTEEAQRGSSSAPDAFAYTTRTVPSSSVTGAGCGYSNDSASDVFDAVRHAISRQKDVEICDDTLELDTILSRVPYQNILQTLFGGAETLPEDVPVVSRVYEESFMRESVSKDERNCVMGPNCECMFIDPNMPFISTEFLLPGEVASECSPQMCVLCCRKVTQQLFHDILYCGATFRAVIQRFGNICDQPGEYARECLLICPPSANVQFMPLPIVAHQRNRYSVRLCNGVKYLKQHRVYFECFNAVPTDLEAAVMSGDHRDGNAHGKKPFR